MPAGIVLGVSVAALHDDLMTTGSGSWGTGNAEVPAYTELMAQARQDARFQLEQEVRGLGADGVVVSGMTFRVRTEPCASHSGGTDHFVDAVLTGTAVARFGSERAAILPPSMAVLSLGLSSSGRASL